MGTQSSTHPFRICLAILLVGTTLHGSAQIGNLPVGTIRTTINPLGMPSVVAFDSLGNLYVAETGKHLVRRFDVRGQLTSVAGNGVQGFSGDGGLATAAQLDSPQGLVVTADALYVADTHNQRIRRVDLASGVITTIAGTGVSGFSGDSGLANVARLNNPTALTMDVQGNLYVADTANHRIRRIGTDNVIKAVAGTGVQGYSGDTALAIQARIDSPTGLATDARGNLYLADTHNNRVRRIDISSGIISTVAGTGSVGRSGDGSFAVTAQLALPNGLSTDGDGNLYVSDTSNHRIRRIDATTGLIGTLAGTGAQGFAGDSGAATSAALDSPRSVATYTGQVSLADTGNGRVRQVIVPATTVADFTLIPTGSTTQTISSGSRATFTFVAQAQGALSSIALATSGLPGGATASFSPSVIPASGATTNFTLTISTTKGVASNLYRSGSAAAALAAMLPFLFKRRRVRKLSASIWLLSLMPVLASIAGCGNLIVPGTPLAVISVIGTATGPGGAIITHSAAVTLTQTLP